MPTDTSVLQLFHREDFEDPTASRSNRILRRIYEQLEQVQAAVDLSGILARLAALEATSGGGGTSGGGTTVVGAPTKEALTVVDQPGGIYTISVSPTFMLLFRNGALLEETTDYTISSMTITFGAFSIPNVGDKLWAIIW